MKGRGLRFKVSDTFSVPVVTVTSIDSVAIQHSGIKSPIKFSQTKPGGIRHFLVAQPYDFAGGVCLRHLRTWCCRPTDPSCPTSQYSHDRASGSRERRHRQRRSNLGILPPPPEATIYPLPATPTSDVPVGPGVRISGTRRAAYVAIAPYKTECNSATCDGEVYSPCILLDIA